MLVFLVLCALLLVVPLQADHGRVLRQSRPQRPDRRGAADRHRPVVSAGDPALSRGLLGQQFPDRRSRPGAVDTADAAGADGGDPGRRAYRADVDLAADHAASAGFDRHPAGRGPRHFALHDRPAGVSRPARHLLGPDRDRRLGRQGDRRPQGRRRCRLAVRHPERGGSPPRSAAWEIPRSRRRCSVWPAR